MNKRFLSIILLVSIIVIVSGCSDRKALESENKEKRGELENINKLQDALSNEMEKIENQIKEISSLNNKIDGLESSIENLTIEKLKYIGTERDTESMDYAPKLDSRHLGHAYGWNVGHQIGNDRVRLKGGKEVPAKIPSFDLEFYRLGDTKISYSNVLKKCTIADRTIVLEGANGENDVISHNNSIGFGRYDFVKTAYLKDGVGPHLLSFKIKNSAIKSMEWGSCEPKEKLTENIFLLTFEDGSSLKIRIPLASISSGGEAKDVDLSRVSEMTFVKDSYDYRLGLAAMVTFTDGTKQKYYVRLHDEDYQMSDYQFFTMAGGVLHIAEKDLGSIAKLVSM